MNEQKENPASEPADFAEKGKFTPEEYFLSNRLISRVGKGSMSPAERRVYATELLSKMSATYLKTAKSYPKDMYSVSAFQYNALKLLTTVPVNPDGSKFSDMVTYQEIMNFIGHFPRLVFGKNVDEKALDKKLKRERENDLLEGLTKIKISITPEHIRKIRQHYENICLDRISSIQDGIRDKDYIARDFSDTIYGERLYATVVAFEPYSAAFAVDKYRQFTQQGHFSFLESCQIAQNAVREDML